MFFFIYLNNNIACKSKCDIIGQSIYCQQINWQIISQLHAVLKIPLMISYIILGSTTDNVALLGLSLLWPSASF